MLNFVIPQLLGGRKVHPLYRAVLARADALGYAKPSIQWQIKQNDFCTLAYNGGILTDSDIFYVFYHDGSREFSYINWVNASTFTISGAANLVFTSLDGIKGTGALDSYMDTGWSELTHGVKWTLGNSSVFTYIKESAQEAAYFCGAQDGTSTFTRLRPRSTGDVYGLRIDHGNNETTAANTDASGLWHLSRVSNSVEIWKSGVLLNTVTNTVAGSKVSATHNILRTNTAGATPSVKTCQLYGAGGAMIETGKKAYLNTIFESYKTL